MRQVAHIAAETATMMMTERMCVMMAASYPTKKALKEAIGTRLRYVETSMFGEEYRPNTMLTVVGPAPTVRKWYANVWTDDNGIITKVK